MAPERRKADIDLRDIRDSQIRTETLIKEVFKPAISQVYDNENAIIKIKAFQSTTKYIGGLISSLVMFVAIRSVWDWIKNH